MTMPAANSATSATSSAQASRGYAEAPRAEVVSTGGASAPAPTAAAPTTSSAPVAGDFKLPDWFEELAKKMLAAPADGLGLPELTLVSAVSGQQQRLAASPRAAAPAAPTQATARSTSAPEGGANDENVELLAREIYDEVRRLFEVARERNGDLWR
jgi:hypothetical protein